MKLVQHLLDSKGNDVISIDPDQSVLDAIKRMAEVGIGSLVVLDGDRLAGILSERDIVRELGRRGCPRRSQRRRRRNQPPLR